ncbi:MAG: AMP phosphorylase [Promethearchaeota archaeon]
MIELSLKRTDVATGNVLIVVLSEVDAKKSGIKAGDRVQVSVKGDPGRSIVSIVDVTSSDSFVAPGEVVAYREVTRRMQIGPGDEKLFVRLVAKPPSFKAIRKKMKGKALTASEVQEIVKDATSGHLSQVELSCFLTSLEINGLSEAEVVELTRSMGASGEVVNFNEEVYEKHSTGGVPGNKISLIIVPIVAAAGLPIPKTSTRAITSPAGTADTMECLAPIEHAPKRLKEILRDVGGFIAWGGGLTIAPVDGIFIDIERVLKIDPKGLIIASILAKKLAMSVKKLALDIPCGKGTKFPTPADGRQFAHEFNRVAKKVGIHAECALTLANQPVGHAVGPALEAREALELLMDYSKGPNSLIEKATTMAGVLLEMGGKAQAGTGHELAKDILKSGRAYEKMKEIIAAQGGDPGVRPEDLPIGEHVKELFSTKEGYVTDIDNAQINEIAKTAGCPLNKGAGVVLFKKIGAFVREGDKLFEIYAESEEQLNRAVELFNQHSPVILGGMLIERI